MARQKSKLCPGCNTLFKGKDSAKTCSARCRKRIERAKKALTREAHLLAQSAESALKSSSQAIHSFESVAFPQLAPPLATETADNYSSDTVQDEPPTDWGDLNWSAADTMPGWATPATPVPDPTPTTPHPVGHIISPQPPAVPATQSAPLAPPTPGPQPLPASPPAVPQPIMTPPVVQSLETKPTAQHWQQLQNSWQLPATQPPPTQHLGPSVAQTTPLGSVSALSAGQAPPTAIDPSAASPALTSQSIPAAAVDAQTKVALTGQGSGLGPFNFFKHRPILTGLSFVALVALVSGAFALSGLLHQSQPSPTNLSSQGSDTGILSIKDAKLGLNLDTVLAKGKTLTVGQIIAGPGSSILQVTGDVQSTSTLYASGGTSSLNNSGLVINKVTVCTANGCNAAAPTGPPPLTALPVTTTLQGNIFNGSSQLVQLTASGALPALNGAALTAVDAATLQGNNAAFYQSATNITTGILADARLSTNVALLAGSGPQTFTGNNKFSGSFLSQDSTNSTTAFMVQNAAGTSNVLVADTISSRIGIGNATPAYTLDVAGDINSSTGVRVGGALLCSPGGCTAAGGSNSYIQNSTALQTANFNIQSAATNSVTGTIRAALSQTADLLQLKNQAAVNILTISPTGNTLFQPSTNSISAFSVQNAAGTSLLISGDTLNARVAIATAIPPNYTLDVGGDINSATGLRVAGNLVCSTTCTPGGGSGNYIQNGTAVQTANFAIQSDLNSHIVAYIRGASGQSADLLDIVGKGAADVNLPIATFGSSGKVLLQNAVDSTTAFQVQNAGGNNYIAVDTSGANLNLGNGGIASTIQIGNTTGAVAQTINIGNNATALSSTALVLGNVISGSTFTTEAGTGTTALFNGATAHTIQLGTGGAVQTITIGSTNSTSPLTLQSGIAAINLKPAGGSTNIGVLVKNVADSTNSFQIQNAAGTSNLFIADTTDSRIGIGTAAPGTALEIGSGGSLKLSGGTTSGQGNIQLGAAASGSWDTNLIYLNSTAGTGGYMFGSTPAFAAANGPYFAGRGNTYSAVANQRGLIGISAGNVTTPTANEGSVTLRTGADAARLIADPTGNVYIGGSITSWSSPSGATLSALSNGNVGISTTTIGTNNRLLVNAYSTVDNLATAQVNTNAATNKGLVVQGFASQSADLLQLQNSSGTVLDNFTSTGALGIGGPAANGVLTIGANTTTAAGGIYFGTDTNLYRSAAGVLKTDGNLTATDTIAVQGPLSTSARLQANSGGNLGTYLTTNLDVNNNNARDSTLQAGWQLDLNAGTADQLRVLRVAAGAAQNTAPSTLVTIANTGKITASGGFNGSCLSSGSFSGSAGSACNMDIAEIYHASEPVGPGDVLVVDQAHDVTVKKAAGPYDTELVGVVSSTPGLVLGLNNGEVQLGGESSTYAQTAPSDLPAVTLTGRVPVHVTNENGAIAPGDYLTSSSTPGYAMKATQAGMVIGKALATFDGTSGTVLVLVGTQYYNPQPNLQGGNDVLTSLMVSGQITTLNLTVSGDATIQGNLTLAGHIIGNSDTSGVLQVSAGSTQATYNFVKAYTQMPNVVATPENDPGGLRYWITKTSASFILNLSGPAATDLKFDYMVQQ